MLSVAGIVRWQCETGCCAAEMSACVKQVGRGASESGDGVSRILHNLRVGGGGHSVHQKGWGWFFWLVQLWCGDQWDLRNDVEGRDASTLVL